MSTHNFNTVPATIDALEDLKQQLAKKGQEWITALPADQQVRAKQMLADGVLLSEVSCILSGEWGEVDGSALAKS